MFIHIILELNPNKRIKNTSILMLCWFLVYLCEKYICHHVLEIRIDFENDQNDF
jgi:hypothetical protein